MAAKKAPKDNRPQSERFIEAAKASGADESGKKYERAMKKIVRPTKRKK